MAKVATPENWHSGEPVIVPPPATVAEAETEASESQGYDYTDWYFSKKSL